MEPRPMLTRLRNGLAVAVVVWFAVLVLEPALPLLVVCLFLVTIANHFFERFRSH
jgi:hypothetical protein